MASLRGPSATRAFSEAISCRLGVDSDALGMETGYISRGRLEGPVFAAESITCGSTVNNDFNLADDHLHGGLALGCTASAAQNRAPVTISFKLDRALVETPQDVAAGLPSTALSCDRKELPL